MKNSKISESLKDQDNSVQSILDVVKYFSPKKQLHQDPFKAIDDLEKKI